MTWCCKTDDRTEPNAGLYLITPKEAPLVPIQLFDEAAVFDFFQDRRIDEVARIEIFHLRAGLGELIDDGLNAFAVRIGNSTDQSLGHLVVGRLHQGQIVEAGIFFQDVQRDVFVGFENVDALEIRFHESGW